MHFSFLLPAAFAVTFVNAAMNPDLLAFLKAHPGKNGVGSTDAEFLAWKQTAFTANVTAAPVLPKAFIIQLKPGSTLDKRDEDTHAQFHKRAAANIDYSTRQEFKNTKLFFGLSIQVKDDANETTILAIPNVLKVWPLRIFPRPETRLSAPPIPGAISSARKIAATPPTAGPRANTNSVHRQTEVDRVHALGIKGVDWKHPALGGCFGEGCRISFGKDFIGDSYDQTGIPVTDDDPYAGCTGGHGTHTMGTVGMLDPEDSPWGLVGVAPEATLGMYRVFGCYGGAPEDIMVLAFEQAYLDKVDVLSMSLGSYLQWEEEDPFQYITSALESLGIAVIVSNGNNGVLAGIPSSPAIGKGVIAVGSAQNSVFPTVYGFKDSRGRSMKYSGDPWPVDAPADGLVVYDFLKIAANTSSPNGCGYEGWWAADNAILDKGNSIIVLPYSPDCSWASMIATAQGLGFHYSLVYAVEDGDIFDQEYNVLDPLPPYYGITINAVDGRTLVGGLANSKEGEYKFYFTNNQFESLSQVTAGSMSNFSSWGPTSDTLVIKPQISAPGGSILSTWPLEGTGYAILSGTSMACPYIAGAYALVKSQFPGATVQQIREKLQSTARNIPYAYGKDIRAPIAQQGGGMVNVYNAIHFESNVSPSELNLGDLDQLKPREITIENKSSRTKTYVISHEPAGETNLLPYTYASPVILGGNALPGVYKSYADVIFSTTTITIKSGESAKFIATFNPPKDIADAFLPVYSGFIKVTNNNDAFTIAYLGQPYSRYKADYIDASTKSGEKLPELLTFNEDYSQTTVNDIMSFDFGLNNPGQNYPYLNWINLQSDQYWRADIVPYNTSFVPDYYGFTFNESNPYGVPDSALPLQYPNLKFSGIDNGTEAGVETYGLWTGGVRNERPSAHLYYLAGEMLDDYENSTGPLPAGDYRALLRILRWGGDSYKEEGYQSWLSPVIRVNRTLARKVKSRK